MSDSEQADNPLPDRSAIDVLLNRSLPEGYAEEWLARVREAQAGDQGGDTISVLLFRLENDWLGLRVGYINEVTTSVPVHTVPHRTNEVMRGVANVRGELQLAVSLKSLLGLKKEEGTGVSLSRKVYSRMVVISQNRESFVFEADEVFGIHHLKKAELSEVPVTLSKAMATFTEGIFHFREIQVGLLDGDLIFHSLRTQYL